MAPLSTLIRRSSRKRTANTKYANDAFDKDIIRLLRESSESTDPVSPGHTDGEEKDLDDEFDAAQVEVERDHVAGGEEDDDLSMRSGSAGLMSDESEVQTPGQSEDDNISIATTGISNREDHEGESRRFDARRSIKGSAEAHSRGLLEADRRGPKDRAAYDMFGPTAEELNPIRLSRDKWSRGRDITLPSHITLASLVADGVYGRHVRYGVPVEMLRTEAGAGWQWYRTNRGARFRERQVVEGNMDEEARIKYLPRHGRQDHDVLGGPFGQQKRYSIRQQGAIRLGEPWPMPEKRSRKTSTETPSEHNNRSAETSKIYHQGWLINVGQKAHCLAWAPTCKGVTKQYLAVACANTLEQRRVADSVAKNRAPAFTPLPPHPSSVDIWVFEAETASEKDYASLNQAVAPRLVQVLCIDWGETRQLAWNLCLREDHDVQSAPPQYTNLGLLAFINSDGNARVLDVNVPVHPSTAQQYSHVKEPVFEASPPQNSVFTTISWASPTDLLLGTSSGLLEVYNILAPTTPGTSPAKPHVAHQLRSTYLLDVKPAYPSLLPTLIASSSAAGDLRLTDLRNPHQDNVQLHRSRLPSPGLVYSPLASTWITAINNIGNNEAKSTTQPNIVCHSIRRFYNSVSIARLPEGGLITSLAASRWHPSILAGTSGGIVYATNYLRRYLPAGRPTDKSSTQAWLQKVCQHEWIPLSSSPPTSKISVAEAECHPEANAIFHGLDTRPGTSRFHEGFKPEKIDLTQPGHKARLGKSRAANDAASSAQTIFEEEEAVTAMDWNPNLRCAGWVAVAFGSGILRVQDLAWQEDRKGGPAMEGHWG